MNLKRIWIFILAVFLLVSGCSNSTNPAATLDSNARTPDPGTEIYEPTAIPTPQPKATENIPLAVSVNGEGILLQDFNDEVQRLLKAAEELEQPLDDAKAGEMVLRNLVDTILLAQSAREAGFKLSDETYQQKVVELIEKSGGDEAFQKWLVDNQYTSESFERMYRLQIEASWMRDIIINKVETRAEQIRARQILTTSKTKAEEIYAKLVNGEDFSYYAWGYDQLSGGELGWFPRGYLVLPQVEEQVFNLQPGEFTGVIESTYGYHIVQVMERELDRELTKDTLLQRQRQALSEWLENKRASSNIEIIKN